MNAKINPQIFSVLGATGFSSVSSLWEILNGNCDAMRVKIHYSLKSPLCSCVSITAPDSSNTRMIAECERLRNFG